MRKQSVDSKLDFSTKQKIDCVVQKFFNNKMSHQECRLKIIDILNSQTVSKTEYDNCMQYVDSILSERQLVLPI